MTCLADFPRFCFKEFRAPVDPASQERLERLVGAPSWWSPWERWVVRAATSWPVALVGDAGEVVGVVIPAAPDIYFRGASSGTGAGLPLTIDVLVLPPDRQRDLGVPVCHPWERLALARSVARVAAVFEGRGLCYLDWSWANVFWSRLGLQTFVIDVDGMSFGARTQVETPQWEDWLIGRGTAAGLDSDRYRVALLVARMLTLRRDARDAVDALGSVTAWLPSLCRTTPLLAAGVLARRPADRPHIARIAEGLEAAMAQQPGGVTP